MPNFVLQKGKYSGFTTDDAGIKVRKIFTPGDIIELDATAAINLGDVVISVEEAEVQQRIVKARAQAEARVQAELDAEHEAEQAKRLAAVKAAAAKAAGQAKPATPATQAKPA